ncbi:MAG TPA: S9 family peptidase [Terracidiphilus sp.]|nr:S9 family peptidase [Terracidiphilus sp.]
MLSDGLRKGLRTACAAVCVGAAVCVLAGGGASAQAQKQAVSRAERQKMDEVLRGLNRGTQIGEVAVSPDGSRIAWTESGPAGAGIEVAPMTELTKTTQVTARTSEDQICREGQIAWEPEGKALAFFSDCASGDGQEDLYLTQFDGNPARRVTELKGYEESPEWSPDGKKVAFLYVKGATRPSGALAAEKPWAGVIGEDNIEVQRVAVARVDADEPNATEVTPEDLHVFEFDWRPDSKGLAYVAADPPGENNWWVAKLYTQALGGEAKAILAPATVSGALHGLQIAVPRWRPDGKEIAFIGGLMSDQGATGGDVWVVSAEGGAPRDITAGRPTSPAWVEWDGNDSLFVSELAGGDEQLTKLSFAGDPVKGGQVSFGAPVFQFAGSVGDGRLWMSLSSTAGVETADRGTFVFAGSTFERAPEIYEARVGRTMVAGMGAAEASGAMHGVVQLTHLNDGAQPAWGKAVPVRWRNEGFHVQGWLLLPRDYDPAKKYPLIVEVHGGPASAVSPHWGGGGGLSPQAFSAVGYFVLQPNPRGSFGQGEAFTQANRKDFGYGDLRDILAGVTKVEETYPIDPARVGITGWSYGGFMTMFAITQTGRFRAAVSGAGLSDWLSYYGENQIDQWMIPYFGASVYDDPAVYAKSSAINYIKKAHTPTLVVVGDRDGECPAPQSFEFWHALKDEGVPTELVVYPNEGHGFVNPAHRRDVMVRAVEWFEKYMPARGK